MDFFDFLVEVAKRGYDIFSYIWGLDYSFVHKEILGVSIMDLASFYIGVMVFWEFIKWLGGSVGSVLQNVFQLSFAKVFNWLFQYSVHVFHRCMITIRYLQTLPLIQRKRDEFSIHMKTLQKKTLSSFENKVA